MKILKEKANKCSLDENINTYAERDVKEFIQEIIEEIDKGIKLTIKLYPHKKGEELAGEIFEYLSKIIKQKGNLE